MLNMVAFAVNRLGGGTDVDEDLEDATEASTMLLSAEENPDDQNVVRIESISKFHR